MNRMRKAIGPRTAAMIHKLLDVSVGVVYEVYAEKTSILHYNSMIPLQLFANV